jgi:hypothetical protein
MRERRKRWTAGEWFTVLLALVTLMTFAVGESLYEMLARNQAFLTLRLQSNLQLLEIIFLFNLLPALLLFCFWLLLRRLHAGLARGFLALAYGAILLVFFLQIHNYYMGEWWLSLSHSYIFWVIPAGLLGLFPLRFPKVFRSFVLVLSPVLVIFPGLFLLRTWAGPTDLMPQESASATQPVPTRIERPDLPPVVVVILDEFTLNVLLDETGEIDARRYPHFRALADHSHWFRNATANADYTYQSFPAIFTGNYPTAGSPSYLVYPNNLFTLLSPYYEIYAYESWTRFCIPRRFHCLSATREDVGGHFDLLRDIAFLFAARIIPQGVDVGLPDLRRTWGPFDDAPTLVTARVARFEKFLDALPAVAPKDHFFFLFHHLLPHSPYLLRPDGSLLNLTPFDFEPDFSTNPALVRDLLERYREQVMYVDSEVGRMVAEMKRLGLYDRSLLIVTADHGVSYRPEAPGRDLKEDNGTVLNADLILSIPLFIKLPHETQGVVSNRDAQLIDLLPTLADLFHIQVPWEPVGRTVFSAHPEPRLKVAYSRFMKRYEFPSTLGLAQPVVRFAAAGEGEESPLLGQPIADCAVENNRNLEGDVDNWGLIPAADGHSRLVANGWAVRVDTETVPESIALAVNGRILAVTSPRYDRGDIALRYQQPLLRKSGWYVTLPFDGNEVKTIQAYVVLDAEKKKLAALKIPPKSVG